MLVLPLEQFILNTFEKAPWRDKARERDRQPKKEDREKWTEKKQSKAQGQVRRSLQAKDTFQTADGESEYMHRHRLAPVNKQVNVTDSEEHLQENVFTLSVNNRYQITEHNDLMTCFGLSS